MIGSAVDDHLASVELGKEALRWALQLGCRGRGLK